MFFVPLFAPALLLCAAALPIFAEDTKDAAKDAGKNASAFTDEKAENKAPQPADEGRAWATQGRLYVVIAADSKLEGIAGTIAEKNGSEISKLFRSNVAAGAYAVVRIPADLLTRQMFFSVLSSLRATPQDAVVVYVSGKGGYDRKNGAYYTLSKGKEDLYRSEIRNALAKKNVRLSVLITDNADGKAIPKKPEPKKEEPKTETAKTDASKKDAAKKDDVKTAKNDSDQETGSTKFAGEKQILMIDVEIDDDNKTAAPAGTAVKETAVKESVVKAEERKTTTPLFFSLFFNSKGTIDIQSASSGQFSLPADSGLGIFTETFAALLKANANKSLSWYRLFPYLKRGNALMFKSIYPDGIDVENGGSVQQTATPVLLTLDKINETGSEWTKVYPHGNQFDVKIADVKEKEIKLSDSDSKTAAKLIAETITIVRPQNDAETGTHEDYAAIDPDNTVNGANGEPFGENLGRVEPPRTGNGGKVPPPKPKDEPGSKKVDQPEEPQGKKPVFGVRAKKFDGGGVQILEVVSGTVADRAGLKKGYIILKIDGKKIFNEKDYASAIDETGSSMEIEYRDNDGLKKQVIELRR